MNEQTQFNSRASETDEHSRFAPEPTSALSQARDLDAQLVAARRVERGAQHRLAILLTEMADSGLFRLLGYTSIDQYAEIVLEIGFRLARDLLRIGRSLSELPALNAALASGEVDYSKAREIVRIATTETDGLWTERAKIASTREIERDVVCARRGDLPPTGNPQPLRQPARSRVTFEMEAADREILMRALALLRQQTGVSPAEVEDGALLAGLARQFVQQVESAQSASGERYKFVVRHCPSCDEVCGTTAEVSDTIRAEAACDAEIVDMRPGPTQGSATRAIAPKLRRRVMDRAGERWRNSPPPRISGPGRGQKFEVDRRWLRVGEVGRASAFWWSALRTTAAFTKETCQSISGLILWYSWNTPTVAGTKGRRDHRLWHDQRQKVLFQIHEPKPRIISVADFRDRVVHHALCAELFESQAETGSYAGRPGKGSHAALRRAQSHARYNLWFVKLDVRYFERDGAPG